MALLGCCPWPGVRGQRLTPAGRQALACALVPVQVYRGEAGSLGSTPEEQPLMWQGPLASALGSPGPSDRTPLSLAGMSCCVITCTFGLSLRRNRPRVIAGTSQLSCSAGPPVQAPISSNDFQVTCQLSHPSVSPRQAARASASATLVERLECGLCRPSAADFPGGTQAAAVSPAV